MTLLEYLSLFTGGSSPKFVYTIGTIVTYKPAASCNEIYLHVRVEEVVLIGPHQQLPVRDLNGKILSREKSIPHLEQEAHKRSSLDLFIAI